MFTVNAREKFSVEKSKETFNHWYDQIIPIADVIDKKYPVKGMPIFKPYGWFMHEQIMKAVEEEWTKQSIWKVQFPLFIPMSYLEKEESHLDGFKAEVFWARGGSATTTVLPVAGTVEGTAITPVTPVTNDENECALRPTSETAMYATFKEWIRSHADLPLKIHQTCSVYRFETKSTLPLIRAREIYWNEAHTVHASEAEALENLEDAWKSYTQIIQDDLCFTGLRLRRPIWDTFPGAVHTDVMDTIMPSGKVLQVVGAHHLGQKFAKVFDIVYNDEKGNVGIPHMTCYGVSTRLLAACLSIHGDSNGLSLPTKIAPIQIVVVPILFKGQETDIIKAAANWVVNCKKALPGIRIHFDLSDKQPGNKFYFWEMKGVPIRVEIGPRDIKKGQICLCRRTVDPTGSDKNNKIVIPMDSWTDIITQLKIHDDLLRSAGQRFHDEHVFRDCKSLEELKDIIEKRGGFVRIPYHTTGIDGKEGDQKIHEICGGEIRGFIPNESTSVSSTETCLVTGKTKTCYAYIAKSY